MNFLKHLFLDLRWLDLIDIILVFYIVYWMLLLIKGTRAVQMLIGLSIIGAVYILSLNFGLLTISEILSKFFNYAFFIVIILFQEDFRKALATVGRTPFFGKNINLVGTENFIEQLIRACIALARKRVGAIIVLERKSSLSDFVEIGVELYSKVNAELILSIFNTSSPIHDGAIVIKDNIITSAGCFLPLSKNTHIDKSFGTRHRAGIGITEETDAVSIIVSEEKKEVSLAINGKLIENLDGPSLRKKLYEIFKIVVEQ